MSTPSLDTACEVLRAGGVIAYPTEAVWGLGCDPNNAAAIERLLLLKRRPREKGLILVAANQEQIAPLLAPLSTSQRAQLDATWPGPITWLIPDTNQLFSSWVRGDHASVAIRVSAHPVVQRLCLAYGGPVVSTSANTAGEPEIRDRSELEAVFGDTIDGVVSGSLGNAAGVSEIRDLLTGAVLR